MPTSTLLRKRDDDDEQPVGFVELFFDLVFVLAVTQLAVVLGTSQTLTGLWQTALLFAATWWLWLLTSWAMNWLDPERQPVRVMIFMMMAGGLGFAAVMPAAFGHGDGGLAFALLYVAMQLGRTAFTIYALKAERLPVARNFVRMLCWLAGSGVLWIGGALADPAARFWWWTAAAAVDLLGPAFGHYVLGLGKTDTRDWDIVGSHLSERCALFLIIALGEVIIVLGQTYAGGMMSLERTAALVVSFIGCAAMWWIYFDVGAKRGMQRIEEETNPARIARIAYTWLHMPIVFGIVLIAVADKKVLGAPLLATTDKLAFLALGGPAVFLAGEMAFKATTAKAKRLPRSHLAGIAALALLVPFAMRFSGLALVTATTAILLGVAVLERVLRTEPTPHADDPSVIVETEG